MKILAIEKEVPGITDRQFEPHLRAEAARAWELHQSGTIRELYFRTDWPGAVLVLECAGVEEARAALNTLPLVARGLIGFDLLPVKAYSGFSRLFSADSQSGV
jgi:hypothetical protein